MLHSYKPATEAKVPYFFRNMELLHLEETLYIIPVRITSKGLFQDLFLKQYKPSIKVLNHT
jgi:hypothetical protein